MHPTNCLNCSTILTADDRFCPTCGQKTNIHRITFKHILHEFFHAFTHADTGFLGMTADLAVRPGLVAKEYVTGKRKKYYSPFTFFILSIGILVFSSHYFRAIPEPQKPNPKVLAQMQSDAARKYYLNLIDRTNTGFGFMEKHLNTVSMAVLPFYAFIAWIFFRRRGYNYSEILVAYMLFQSFIALFMAVFVVPWIGRFRDESIAIYFFLGLLLLMSLYVGAAEYKFFDFKKRWSFVFTSLSALLGYLLFFVLMTAAILYYIFRSNFGDVVKALLKKLF